MEKRFDFISAFRYNLSRFNDTPNAAFCGNNSVVECNLAKVDVASSNLVSRSIIEKSLILLDQAFFCCAPGRARGAQAPSIQLW